MLGEGGDEGADSETAGQSAGGGEASGKEEHGGDGDVEDRKEPDARDEGGQDDIEGGDQ